MPKRDNNTLIISSKNYTSRILIGVPLTGLVRGEYMMARYGQIHPINWSSVEMIQWLDQYSPLGFLVADARNLIVDKCIRGEFEWLLFIDHDVVLAQGAFVKVNQRMLDNKIPMWSGLYFAKAVPSDPLVFRGTGNAYYKNWKLGDEVWVDGIPMGITLIHSSILKILWNESEEYKLMGKAVRRVFETPYTTMFDPETGNWFNYGGTEDLALCARIIREDVLRRAGWPKIAKRKFPFMIDTALFCRHIDPSGLQYPSRGEELQYVRRESVKTHKEK